jgi:hypothetical protein
VLPSVAVLLLIALHWAQQQSTVAQIDLPPAYDPANVLHKCASVWSDYRSYFGSVDSCFSWLPYRLAELGLYRVFGASIGQALLFGIPLIASWLGAFACARAFGVAPAGAFLGGWVYAFNPARQSMFGVFATGEACAALMPWVFYWIIVAAREPQRRGVATASIAAMSFALLVVLAITPQLLAALLLGSLALAALLFARSPDRRRFAAWTGRTLLFATAVSLWWLVPNAIAYLGAPIAHPVAASAVSWTFARASLLNELRFCALWFWQYAEYNPWAIEFDRNPLLYASGFVPIAGCMLALLVCRGERLAVARYLTAIGLVLLFIAKGTHPPLAQLNLALYSLPGMVLFIEPYGPILIAAFAFSMCAGLAANALLASPSAASRRFAGSIVGAMVALLFCNNAASVTGAIFHEKTQATPGVHIRLPDTWREAAAWLNDAPNAGGVAVFPPDDFYQADYDWGYHGVDTLPAELIHRDVLMPGAPWGYTELPEAAALDAAIDRFVAARSPLTATLLRSVGIRYALVRFDTAPVDHGFRATRDEYVAALGTQPAASFGDLEIFDLGEPLARLTRPSGIASAGSIFASVRPAPASTPTIYPYRSLRQTAPTRSLPMPAVIGETTVDAATIRYDVFNPGMYAMTAMIEVGAWPRRQAVYRLTTSGGYDARRTANAGPISTWIHFSGVRLLPGDTTMTVAKPQSFASVFSSFFAPRPDLSTSRSPTVDQLQISPASFGRSARAMPPAPSLDIKAPLRADPRVTVIAAIAGDSKPTGWRIDVNVGGIPFTCFDEFWTGQEYDLGDSIRRCAAVTGQSIDDDDASDITAHSLTRAPDAPLPHVDVAAVEVSETTLPDFDGARLRPMVAESIRTGISGIGAVLHLRGQNAWPLVLAQAYSPTWLAFDATHVRVLRHYRAFGWSNAWDCPPAATIVLMNWLSLASLVLAIGGAVMTFVLWWRA